MFCSVRPSAQPEAITSWSGTVRRSRSFCASVSRPSATASEYSMATVKWCMDTAATRDGEREPRASWVWSASSGPAPWPPYSSGISRPTPPWMRKRSMIGPPGFSRSA